MSTQIAFETFDTATDAILSAIDSGLHSYNSGAADFNSVRPLVSLAKLNDGRIVGGLKARTWGRCCEIQQLWVEQEFRRKGIGQRLMQEAEAEASRRGCDLIYLETFSFQSPEFYQRAGFEIVCEFRGYPDGVTKATMRKSIATS